MRKTQSIIPLESEEQKQLFEWAAYMANAKYPELDLMYHIPNGGSRNKIEAARLKSQGVKRGVPDICLPVPRWIYAGLYIELKRKKGGALSKHQANFIKKLRTQGYRVEVCKGFQDAANAIEKYLKGD